MVRLSFGVSDRLPKIQAHSHPGFQLCGDLGMVFVTEKNLAHRVVSSTRHGQPYLKHLGIFQHGLVCYTVQPQVPHICVANLQCQSSRPRCSDNRLGGGVLPMHAPSPPPKKKILTQVLRKFSQTQNCTLLLIAPFLPKQSWFPDLLTLSGRTSIPLPSCDKLLKQPTSNVYHQNLRLLSLLAWKLPKHP